MRSERPLSDVGDGESAFTDGVAVSGCGGREGVTGVGSIEEAVQTKTR